MESELRTGLSAAAIVAIVCNSVVGVLLLALFAILYKACQVPSHPEKMPVLTQTLQQQQQQQQQGSEQKYLLTAA